MFSSAAVTSLGDMVSPCRTPLPVLIALLSSCRWTVVELLVRFPSGGRCTHLLYPVLEVLSELHEFALKAFSYSTNAMQSGILYYLHFSSRQLVYDVDVVCR